jgi:NifU-like protein
MGMEALQSALANYRGEKPKTFSPDEEHEGKIVCKCFGVTDAKIKKVAVQNRLRKAEEITNYTKAGGACGSCLDEIQNILDDIWKDKGCSKENNGGFKCMTIVQKIVRIQEALDKEIKPLLEKDSGSIELVDVNGTTIYVRMQGRCAACPVSHITLKKTVEAKLREFICPEINVEEIK